ncbi:GtrA family protein [Corynebacterium lactis]|uniref:Membrane protein n=1 Tax=Corynebacterium lactis RW2-5 TaxID=1408189 RepID=A0A0K2GXF9_9CORY|nr:GtrA family protein [Corynebacterium lactis]ALA66470.1 membrane protein [Corynebacterium lactis RW2-5]
MPAKENTNDDHSSGFIVEDSAAAPMATDVKDEHGLMVQMVRFLISGVIAAVVDFGSTLIFNYGFGLPRNEVSKPLGWVLGTITAYMINRRWTFKAEASWRRTVAVAILYIITFAIQTQLFKYSPLLFDGVWGWSRFWTDTASFVVAQGVATVINFIIQRVFIFRVK